MIVEHNSPQQPVKSPNKSLPTDQLEAMLDLSGDVWYAFAPSGAVVYVNQAAEQFFGRSRLELTDALVWDVLPDQDGRLHALHALAIAEQRLASVELFVASLGCWVELRVQPMGELYVTTARETQARRVAEQARRASDELLRQLMLVMRDVFWISDTATRQVVYVSPSYNDVWGMPSEKLYTDPGLWPQMIHPDEREAIEEAYQRSLHDGVYDVEYRIIRDDGTIRWIHDRALQIDDPSNSIRHTVGVAEDITERKEAEAEHMVLLEREQRSRAAAERALLRLSQLQDVTAMLARALSPKRVADIIVDQVVELMGAVAGSTVLLRADGVTLELARSKGYSQQKLQAWQVFNITDPTPISDAVRLRVPIWLESRAARAARYPEEHLDISADQERAWVAVPLLVNERPVGAIGLSFDGMRPYNREDCNFLVALAQQAAYAIERTRLYEATQEALQASDESLARLNSVLDTAPIGMALWDTELRYIHINPMLAELNNMPASAHIGRTVPELLPALAPLLQPLLERVQQTGEPALNVEFDLTHPLSGQEGHWLTSIYPVRLNGRSLGVGAMAIDISERKRDEATRALLADVTAALSEALTVADVSYIMLARVAPALGAVGVWVAHLSEDREWLDVVQTIGHDVGLVSHWQRTPVTTHAPIAEAVRTRQPVWLETLDERTRRFPEASLSDADSKGTWAAVPMIVNNQPIGGIGFSFPEFRRFDPVERELIQTISQHYAQAYERARLHEAERQAREEAEAAVKLRDQFLSIAAHELRTPLTSLLGNAQLLQRRLSRVEGVAERDAHLLDVIVAQSQRMNKMILALLDVARLQGGQLSISRAPLDLAALAARVASEVQPSLTQHTLACEAPQPVLVDGDELRLEQVLQNLIQNAIKYSPRGGEIVIGVARVGRSARLFVRDTGMGIPNVALPHLFQRFFRAGNADKQHISGMGIGLFVVREIVLLHGGDITVESAEGVGSTFTVTLPLMYEPNK